MGGRELEHATTRLWYIIESDSRIVLRSFERPNSNLNSPSDFNVESEARRHLTGGRVNLKLAGKYPESGQSKHTLMARSSPSSALGEGRVERLKGLTELLYVRVLLSCNSINHPAQPTQWKKPLDVMRIANLNPPPFFFFALKCFSPSSLLCNAADPDFCDFKNSGLGCVKSHPGAQADSRNLTLISKQRIVLHTN